MGEVIFDTPRLVARQWSLELAPEAIGIYGDPEVTRFIGGEPMLNLAEMRKRIQKVMDRDSQLDSRQGSFPVFLKRTGQLIGTALIKPLPDTTGELTEDIEIGWHLARSHWGNGYATEMGHQLLAIGFDTIRLQELCAVVDPPNAASINVAIRLGMRHIGQTSKYYSGQPIEIFTLTQEDWRASEYQFQELNAVLESRLTVVCCGASEI